MADSKADSNSKRRKTMGVSGVLPTQQSTAAAGKKKKSGTEKRNKSSKTENNSEEKSVVDGKKGVEGVHVSDTTDREKPEKGKKGKKENKKDKLLAGRKKSSTNKTTSSELHRKTSAKLPEVHPTSSSRTFESEDSEQVGAFKKSKKRVPKSKSRLRQKTSKEEHDAAVIMELNQRDLELIERAKACYTETNNIWNMAWKIICERFYIMNGAKIAVHELRDSWRRLIHQQWMDEDFRDGNFLPAQVMEEDSPSLPLSLDSWSRGGVEVFPESKRESFMDPFLRDADNFLPFSELMKQKSDESITPEKFIMMTTTEPVPRRKLTEHEEGIRKKSVRLAHTRRKSMYPQASMRDISSAANAAANEHRFPSEFRTPVSPTDHHLPSSATSSSHSEKYLPSEKLDEIGQGIFGNYSGSVDSDLDVEYGESSDYEEEESSIDYMPQSHMNIQDSKQNVFQKKDKKREHVLHKSSLSEDDIELSSATHDPESSFYNPTPITEGSSSEMGQIDTNIEEEHVETVPQTTTTAVSDISSAHNFSAIYSPETDSATSKHLLIVDHTEREKDIPKSTLSADRIENFFASMIRTGSKDSLFDRINYLSDSNAYSRSFIDSDDTEYAYSEESLISLGRSYENLTATDKATYGDFIGDDSDSSASNNSSSSSFQSSFSSDSERMFTSP